MHDDHSKTVTSPLPPIALLRSVPHPTWHRASLAKTIIGTGLGLLAALPLAALAQTPEPEPPQDVDAAEAAALPWESPPDDRDDAPPSPSSSAFQLPRVFVEEDLRAEVNRDGTVRGSFTLTNEEESVQGDIRYEIYLLGPGLEDAEGNIAEDTAPVYDRFVSAESIGLLPNVGKTLSFAYAPPRVPEGDYRLRVRAMTSQGRELGWEDVTVHLGKTGTPFVLLQPETVKLPDGKSALPLEGVNVDAGATVTLTGTVESQAGSPLMVQPVLTWWRWGVTKDKPHDTTALLPFALGPGEKRTISIPFTAPHVPDAYHLVLHATDTRGQRVSTLAEYRIVVKGTSAKVVTAGFEQLATARGAQAVITAWAVGAADRETAAKGTVAIALTDGERIIEEQSHPVDLGPGVQSATATFTLPKDLRNPGFHVTVLDASGATLDAYEVGSGLTTDELARVAVSGPRATGGTSGRVIAIMLLALLVLFIVFAALYRLFWGKHLPRGTLLLLVLVAGSIPLGLTQAPYASANGIHVRQSPSQPVSIVGRFRGIPVTLFINHPRHKNSYRDWRRVRFSYDIRLAACINISSSTEVSLYVPRKGGFRRRFPYEGKNNPAILRKRIQSPYPQSGVFKSTGHPRTTVTFEGKVVFFPLGPYVIRGEDVWNVWLRHPIPPKGKLEAVDDCTAATGWACDPNSIAETPKVPRAVTVKFTADGDEKTGRSVGAPVPANEPRPDVAKKCGGQPNHGFRFLIPDVLKDGNPHTLTAYAVDDGVSVPNDGKGPLPDTLLPGSPSATFTCAPPPSPSPPSSPSPAVPPVFPPPGFIEVQP